MSDMEQMMAMMSSLMGGQKQGEGDREENPGVTKIFAYGATAGKDASMFGRFVIKATKSTI